MRRARAWALGFWVVTFGGGLGASCGGDGEGDEPAADDGCERGVTHLRDCGLLSAGTTRCFVTAEQRDEAVCTQTCLQGLECATLSVIVCTEDGSTNADAVRFDECLTECAEQFGFRCAAVGGASAVPLDFVCDGEIDCLDTSDEIDCEVFECGDGETVPPTWFCDGELDCGNGSDEGAGCEHFHCADRTQVPASFQCDGFADCADASDEAGCGLATLQCP